MFGSVETISGVARTNFRAAWPRVRSPDSVRKASWSTFLRPSRSHSFGRWRRWSFLAKVVFSSYLPSSMPEEWGTDRKSTRLNSSHANISYAVFCLKKKNTDPHQRHDHP